MSTSRSRRRGGSANATGTARRSGQRSGTSSSAAPSARRAPVRAPRAARPRCARHDHARSNTDRRRRARSRRTRRAPASGPRPRPQRSPLAARSSAPPPASRPRATKRIGLRRAACGASTALQRRAVPAWPPPRRVARARSRSAPARAPPASPASRTRSRPARAARRSSSAAPRPRGPCRARACRRPAPRPRRGPRSHTVRSTSRPLASRARSTSGRAGSPARTAIVPSHAAPSLTRKRGETPGGRHRMKPVAARDAAAVHHQVEFRHLARPRDGVEPRLERRAVPRAEVDHAGAPAHAREPRVRAHDGAHRGPRRAASRPRRAAAS